MSWYPDPETPIYTDEKAKIHTAGMLKIFGDQSLEFLITGPVFLPSEIIVTYSRVACWVQREGMRHLTLSHGAYHVVRQTRHVHME